jgi:hypothetical protein
MDSSQLHIKNSSVERGEILFNGGMMIVEGEQVAYSRQMLTSEMLYITDLAM